MEVQLRWRPSPLTLAILTCAVVGLTVAVIGSLWQLVAFVAPLIGVLCSIGRQRSAPAVEVHAEPGTHRCFETEHAQVTVWAATDADSDSVALDLTVSVVPGMRIEHAESDSRGRQTVVVAADRWGRYPIQGRITVGARGGLLQGTGVVDAADVFVFPTAPPQSTDIPRTDLLDRLGTHRTRYIGPGVEYADVRRYVPGDHLRTVNWPVSARRGSLHVTERLTDRAADVVVLVDKYPQPAGPATEATDRTVRGAVQVCRARCAVTGQVWSRSEIVAALAGRRHRQAAVLSSTRRRAGRRRRLRDHPGNAGAPGGGSTRRDLIAFSTLLDTEFALALIDLRKRGHTVVAVDVLEGARSRTTSTASSPGCGRCSAHSCTGTWARSASTWWRGARSTRWSRSCSWCPITGVRCGGGGEPRIVDRIRPRDGRRGRSAGRRRRTGRGGTGRACGVGGQRLSPNRDPGCSDAATVLILNEAPAMLAALSGSARPAIWCFGIPPPSPHRQSLAPWDSRLPPWRRCRCRCSFRGCRWWRRSRWSRSSRWPRGRSGRTSRPASTWYRHVAVVCPQSGVHPQMCWVGVAAAGFGTCVFDSVVA